MPFKSKAQAGAAFGGHLGPEMKKKAHKWAQETPDMEKLPQHVEEGALNEAQLANNVYFWLVENPISDSVDPMTLVYPSPSQKDKKENRGMDPFEFGRMVLGGTTPDQIHGFYLSEKEAIDAAHDLVVAVNEAAKALEEKKAMVTNKVEEVIKKLQEKVNSCMEEGRDQEAQMHLEKISQLREKSRMVEASKKKVEKLEEGWFDRQVASLKGTGAALSTGVGNIGRAIMGNDTKSVALAKNVAKLSQKAKTLDKAIVDMQNDINVLFSPDKLNKAPESFKKALNDYTTTLQRVKSYNGEFMKGGSSLPADQKAASSEPAQSGEDQQQQGGAADQQQQSAAPSQTTSGKKLKFDGKDYTVDKDGKVRVTVGGKRIRLTPIEHENRTIVPLYKDKKSGEIKQVEKRGDKLYIKGTDTELQFTASKA